MRVVALAGIALLVSTAVFAQDTVELKKAQEAADLKKMVAEAQARVPIETPIKGAPYSADVIVEASQTLADGNHIAHQETSRVYRDSDGRTRRDQSATMTSVSPTEPIVSTKKTVILIVDPVAGFSYSLDTEHKVAWRTPIATGAVLQGDLVNLKREVEEKQLAERKAQEARARGGSASVEAGGGSEPNAGWVAVAKEGAGSAGPLEHKVIDGIPVDGHVNTKVIPAGAIGNDLPITITSEEWTSPDLHVLVMTHYSDPRTGDRTYRLSNIVRADPDPSLFMVPPDYTVKDTGIRRNTQN